MSPDILKQLADDADAADVSARQAALDDLAKQLTAPREGRIKGIEGLLNEPQRLAKPEDAKPAV